MDAPEKIWTPANGQSIIPGGVKRWPTDVEYTRTDRANELVAAAYEVAANVVSRAGHSLDAEIRSLTPADAVAALAARDARIREAALREAAEVCFAEKWKPKCSTDWVLARVKGHILDLIEKDQADG